MTQTNITNGEWAVQKWADGTIDIVVHLNVHRMKSICQVTNRDKHGETESNAQLIAVAPKMAAYIDYVSGEIAFKRVPLLFEEWQETIPV